ncbi:phosphoribosylformimino-5-aminoimidazole carboxamide ribotide isomerase, variant 2 [Cordyceps javanica]|uniref:Phosphoribosylformimino-5-aminoimidazole carboxamide ribotide isomerase, variant 2 n=1 Tax=Cordyceps javanica TaxID=43265 RepID=A0A545VCW5_9HYPO|nr:phosphoribosylformimino-5-aminoimidazole carboxamide ribotide isomerase, variant 2 [Cordyceps javanica]TQW10769.1 phosphoribosylformimino-5-aminoimidazole carboxamide ribotide isomerase, variant 2 [Cordyceps javanica]
MTRFRPCIDLHAGQVKQIVGGTLDSGNANKLQTNFVSEQPAAHYAQLYRDNALDGAHVIMLGPGNEEAAKQAIGAWPNGLQVGGGINDKNAGEWIAAGAEKQLEPCCCEFLIHAADNEGLQQGIDEELVSHLAEWCSIPVTYAGGGRNLEDLERVKELSGGKVDLTIGSALDCFGGSGVKFDDCVAWNRQQQ